MSDHGTQSKGSFLYMDVESWEKEIPFTYKQVVLLKIALLPEMF